MKCTFSVRAEQLFLDGAPHPHTVRFRLFNQITKKMSFKVAPYSSLKSGKHMFQMQNLVH